MRNNFFSVGGTEIRTERRDNSFPIEKNMYHVLTVAEAGFSMLDIYGRHEYGLDIGDINAFADRVNNTNESGSLFPKAPISAIPRKFFRDYADSSDPEILKEFEQHVIDFLKANEKTMHISKLVIDFRVCADKVPQQYVDSLLGVLQENLDGRSRIEEIIIIE